MPRSTNHTVSRDLEYLARVAESDRTRNYWTCDTEHADQLAQEFRNPTADTLIENVGIILWCQPDPWAYDAARRLQTLIDNHSKRQLAALIAAA